MKARWHCFKSILTDDIKTYLQYKRVLGRKFNTEESVLRLFDNYLAERYVSQRMAITVQFISEFLGSRSRNHPRSNGVR